MSPLHTSGPWVHRTMTMARKAWAALGRSEIQIVAKNGNVIAAVWCAEDRPGEKEANARLISATPDLLHAAEMALGSLTICGIVNEGDNHTDDPAIPALRAAITKATAP